MSDRNPASDRLATRAVRAGQHRTQEQEQSEPIFTSSSFTFESAEQAAARFAGEEPGNIYSRFTNPTVRMFQERLAALEGGEACVATASGMSAILSTCMALLNAGDHIVCSGGVFGATASLFSNHLSRFGLETTFVPLTDYHAWEDAIGPQTRMLFLETPSNPQIAVADIRAVADIAERRGCILVVDNCLCSPALQRPLELGAHVVVHSATKYLDGQGRCVGGAVVGDAERVGRSVFSFLRTAGPAMSPFNAWVFLKGLETLQLRMRAHSENAQQVAEWLAAQRGIAGVNYPGLPDHPQHELAARQQSGFGGVVSFCVDGERTEAWRLVNGTRMISITANLGDAKSTLTHPASTTHGRNTPEQRAAAGVTEGLLRLSVGLEDARDIIDDLERGLQAMRGR